MAGTPQPLIRQYPITNPDGTPTDYFIRWAQERQIDIKGGITAEQAVQIIEDWSASRNINAGNTLSGGGPLSSDVTINYDGGIADQKDVDLSTPQTDQQVLVWDAASSKWVPADQSGGGGGSSVFLGARLRRTTTQSIPSATATTILWDAEDFDTSGFHDNATNNSRITIPAGVRYVNLTCALASAAAAETDYTVRIFKNGNSTWPGIVAESFRTSNNVAGRGINVSTGPIAVVAGDYFEVQMMNFGAISVTVDGSFFSVEALSTPATWDSWVVSAVGTGTSQAITLPAEASSTQEILVFVNGIRYETTAYTVSGDTVTLTTNAPGDSIQITGVQPSSGSRVSAYVNFVPGSPPTVDSSSGVASVTRTNTGRYRITFSSAFANAYYGMAASGRFATGAGDNVPSIGVDRRSGFGKTTTTIDITCTDQSGNPSDNLSFVNICFFAV